MRLRVKSEFGSIRFHAKRLTPDGAAGPPRDSCLRPRLRRVTRFVECRAHERSDRRASTLLHLTIHPCLLERRSLGARDREIDIRCFAQEGQPVAFPGRVRLTHLKRRI